MLSNRLKKWVNHRIVNQAVSMLVPYRLFINIGIHLVLFALSLGSTLLLVNGFYIDDVFINIAINTAGPLILLRLMVFYYHDLFSGLWRYVSFEDLINIIRASIISTFLFYLLGLVWDRLYVSDQIYLLDLTFCVFYTGGIRLVVRNFRERYAFGRPVHNRKRIYLVGPVDKVQPILKNLVSDPTSHYFPIAVLDPEKKVRSSVRRLCDVAVLSVQQAIDRSHKIGKVDAIIICWPGSYRKQVDKLVDRLKVLGAEFKIFPHYEDILDDNVSISDIRQVEIEDLLERPSVHIDMAGIQAFLRGKTVLVTGGAGSIGSEICRQVAGFEPKRLVIVERSENSMHEFEGEIRSKFPDLPVESAISTINDAVGIKKIMKDNGVDVVFHAAAYKHVPLMEKAPIESAYNNIIGTHNVVKAAVAAGVKRFVMISTDKAVNPANVMGATKRIAEMVVQSNHRKDGTWFMTVRFGNVLGSAGSVIPTFKRQIAAGKAVTVTHPDIERYFMTIPEAVQLVLQAGCMARGGEIFVLDMGQPVKIMKLAEKLISLSGKRPYDDIDIVYSGLRPGEKMYEELFNNNEDLLPTPHPRIKAAVSADVNLDYMEKQIKTISAIVHQKDREALHQKFFDLVPGYQCAAKDRDTADPACKEASDEKTKAPIHVESSEPVAIPIKST